MKIIHCSDIHLDSKLNTHLSGDKKTTRKNELLIAFKNLVEYANDNEVKAIIIAGDFFDVQNISLKTKEIIFELMNKYFNIKFFYLHGNHDESLITQWQNLPENLIIFNETVKSFKLNDVAISGVELTEQNYTEFYNDISLNSEDTNIFVLHGEIDVKALKPVTNKICTKLLANKNIDYLALGHYHNNTCGKIDNRGVYCYSGCLESRGFDETGKKGFVLIDITNKKLNYEFINFSIRNVDEVKVDITNLLSVLEIEKAIAEAVKNFSYSDILKIVITGEVPVEFKLDVKYLNDVFSKKYFFVKFENKTKLKIDIEEYKNDISLRGEFIRTVLNSKVAQNLKDKILVTGVNLLSGGEADL